jgi:hypothetical protein
MSLEEIADNSRTDKNTLHSYLPLYQKLLINKKETATHILEIGILQGGSIKLWKDFFTNATIHGLDKMESHLVWHEIKNDERITLHTSIDAYDSSFFNNTFSSKDIRFDLILDDGSHLLSDMIKFIILYSQVMADDGILIIEDVQQWDWIETLSDNTPTHLKQFIKIYDLRNNKNCRDDILFTIDKLNL